MNSNRYLLIILVTIVGISCSNSNNNKKIISVDNIFVLVEKKVPLSKDEIKFWHFKDQFCDTIPGISLYKAHQYLDSLKTNYKPDTVIVAVIDMSIDIKHEDLNGKIWMNKNEIFDNGLDDDDNGYVDDIHGWNFLGRENGGSNEFTNYEYTRIVKKYKDYFDRKKDSSFLKHSERKLYSRALNKYNSQIKYAQEKYKINSSNISYFNELDSIAKLFFPDEDYGKSDLDSLIQLNERNKELVEYLENIQMLLEEKNLRRDVNEQYLLAKERIEKLLNIEYNERVHIGDNPEDIHDIGYGNSIVNHNVRRMNHGTIVAGILAANRSNEIGTMGISDLIKIMPLVVSGYGDEHDKDMALAVRYAVDNGAQIINISSGKYFSMHQSWILDAIKYAEQKDVLIVHSAGNDNFNLDHSEKYFYPHDMDSLGKQVSRNFITVGSSGHNLDKTLKTNSSSYGKRNVDVFAPGVNIYTTVTDDIGYDFKSGTSCSAPIVSGVAALIKAYYPTLKADDIKNIILESSIRFNIAVEIEKDSLVPFHTLSNSGGIVNAYNAIKMAEVVSKN